MVFQPDAAEVPDKAAVGVQHRDATVARVEDVHAADPRVGDHVHRLDELAIARAVTADSHHRVVVVRHVD